MVRKITNRCNFSNRELTGDVYELINMSNKDIIYIDWKSYNNEPWKLFGYEFVCKRNNEEWKQYMERINSKIK
jgi:hypothetical protein